MKRDITTIVIGTLFLLAGIAIGGTMLGIFDFSINFAGWWTMFLIIPALLTMIQGGINIGNLVLLSVGVILLLDAQNVLPPNFSWRLMLPLVLFIVGFKLLFGNDHRREGQTGRDRQTESGNGTSNGGSGATGTQGTRRNGSAYKTASVLFGGQDIRYGMEDFTGGTYTAMFGSCMVNLKNVTLVGDVVITVTAMFGGIDFILPDNVQVISNVMPILGGTECKYVSSNDPLAPKIIFNGTASFGGITIK